MVLTLFNVAWQNSVFASVQVACELSSLTIDAARLSFPGMWTVRSEGDGGRAVTCGVIVYLPNGLCMRQLQWCPCGLARDCPTAVAGTAIRLDALSTALGSWCAKAVQSPEAACLLHVVPQPVLEASVVTLVLGGSKQPEWRDCSYGCHMPQEPLKLFQWYHIPASEWTQAVQHCLGCSSVRRAVILTESNSTPRKEILCTGESLLFSQLTRSPNWLRCWSTKSLWSHNCSLDWAKIGQSWGCMHSLMHLCVSILNGSLCKARFKTRRSRIGRWPPFLGTMK